MEMTRGPIRGATARELGFLQPSCQGAVGCPYKAKGESPDELCWDSTAAPFVDRTQGVGRGVGLWAEAPAAASSPGQPPGLPSTLTLRASTQQSLHFGMMSDFYLLHFFVFSKMTLMKDLSFFHLKKKKKNRITERRDGPDL